MMSPGSRPIMLVLSTTRQSPATVEHALARAETAHEPLHVLFILDSDAPQSIFERLTDLGFVGERPSQQLSDAIMKEYRDVGGAKIADIKKQAQARGVAVTSDLVEGDFLCTCLEQIHRRCACEVVLTRRRRANLSRRLFGSAVKDLTTRAPCPVMVIDEDDV